VAVVAFDGVRQVLFLDYSRVLFVIASGPADSCAEAVLKKQQPNKVESDRDVAEAKTGMNAGSFVSLGIRAGIKSRKSRSSPIPFKHSRARRLSFVASVEVTELDSEKPLSAHTKNLSLLGCFVETPTPLLEGTKVRLRISHRGANFVAIGRVAFSRPNSGMGIAFLTIEPKSQVVLDLWLDSGEK